MVTGRHLLVDCINVPSEVCLDDQKILEVMARAATAAGATVISQVRYRFGHNSPPGYTAFVLLDESHCSAHCYAEERILAIDLFTCGPTNPLDILSGIQQEIDLGDLTLREEARFLPVASLK